MRCGFLLVGILLFNHPATTKMNLEYKKNSYLGEKLSTKKLVGICNQYDKFWKKKKDVEVPQHVFWVKVHIF